MPRVQFLFIAGLFFAAAFLAAAETAKPVLWYQQPAEKWTEALPIGNGHMGAMVFGGISSERIQFNEDTLWRGAPHDYVRAGAGDQLAEIRRLIFAGQAAEAGKLAKEKAISDPVRQMPYQPFGDLRLTFPGHQMKVLRQRLAELGSDDIFMMDREPRGHKVTLNPQILDAMNSYLRQRLK